MSSLDAILKPKSIAVIGASLTEGTIGSEVMKRLTEYQFHGPIYPINPKGGEMYGLTAYTSILETPGNVDLAVIVINSKFVLDTVDQCAQKGVKGLVVISAGFKEVGGDGVELECQLLEKVKKYGMRMVGPNCVGVINTLDSLTMDATFAAVLPVRGDVGFSSQSGALGCGILSILKDLNIGFSQFVSAGNQADINAEDLLEYWENEPSVKQIMLYMESVVDPKAFREKATRITKKKPIIAIKSGRSEAGASAASSHTGSLAGADKAADALLTQSGVIREFNLKTMFETAQAFAKSPLPTGKRVAIVTNAGGLGILTTDALEDNGLDMAQISDATKDYMRSFLPSAASVKNPVDMIASASMEHYQKCVEACLQDENVDAVIVIYLQLMGAVPLEMARAIMEVRGKYPNKPVMGVAMTTTDFFPSLSGLGDANALCEDPAGCGSTPCRPAGTPEAPANAVNMPWYAYPEEAAHAMARLWQYAEWKNKPVGHIPTYDVDKGKVEAIIKASALEGRDQLTTLKSIDVLRAYGIRACKYGLATNVDEVKALGNSIGYPVVMKMTSKTTSHKTDVGGVVVNIQSEVDLEREYNALLGRLEAKGLIDGLEGVIIQEMVKGNREMVCGIATDPQYGPMMMFGLGGVFIEVMKDVTFRLSPLTGDEALEMIKSVKAYHLLEGARGTKPAQIEQIQETLLRLSQLVNDFKYIDELDINPLLISEATGEGIAVDGRIAFRMAEARQSLGLELAAQV